MTVKPIVLITGSTSGIGRHAALYLATRGLRVLASGRDERKLDALRKEAAEVGVNLETLVLDVSEQSSIDAAVSTVESITSGYGLDVLINNAGYGEMGPIEVVSDERLRAQFDTNVFGLMAVTRAFIPAMRQRGSGRIINVGSLGGMVTLPLFGAYHASKYAIEALSDALRLELKPFGIHVSIIQPGPINTEFTARSVVTNQINTERSVYAPTMGIAAEMERIGARLGVGPEGTSRVIYRAATRRRPRARYATPRLAAVGVTLARLLPTWARDRLFRSTAKLTKQRLMLTAP